MQSGANILKHSHHGDTTSSYSSHYPLQELVSKLYPSEPCLRADFVHGQVLQKDLAIETSTVLHHYNTYLDME